MTRRKVAKPFTFVECFSDWGILHVTLKVHKENVIPRFAPGGAAFYSRKVDIAHLEGVQEIKQSSWAVFD